MSRHEHNNGAQETHNLGPNSDENTRNSIVDGSSSNTKDHKTVLEGLERCSFSERESLKSQRTGKPYPRYIGLDVDSFKLYNSLFGYEAATEFLNDLAKFLDKLRRDSKQFIEKVYRAGGDEFVLCLSEHNADAEGELFKWLSRDSPLPVTAIAGSTLSRVGNDLLVIKSRKVGKDGPLAKRNPSLHEIEIEIEYLDFDYTSADNVLKLILAVTLHWKDDRLSKLPPFRADTFPANDAEQKVWSPGLDIGDWIKEGKKRSRTVSCEWQDKYALRLEAIREVRWAKTDGSNVSSEKSPDFRWNKRVEGRNKRKEVCSNEFDFDGISNGTEVVLDEGSSPSGTHAWKRTGFVKCDPGVERKELPVPRIATTDDIKATGFEVFKGFRDAAKKHMTGTICRVISHDSTIFFPFDYIEDYITFGVNAHERDLKIGFAGHGLCLVCGRKHNWELSPETAGAQANTPRQPEETNKEGTSECRVWRRYNGFFCKHNWELSPETAGAQANTPRQPEEINKEDTSECRVWRRYNGFDFQVVQTVLKAGGFRGPRPCLIVTGWRCSGFYQIRIQLPITLLNLIVTATVFFGASILDQKFVVIVTGFLVLASLLLVSASFVRTIEGQVTIIDVQIITNMLFMLILSGLAIVDWTKCTSITFTRMASDDECVSSFGLLVFVIMAPLMFLVNVVFTLNFCGLATKLRYRIQVLFEGQSSAESKAELQRASDRAIDHPTALGRQEWLKKMIGPREIRDGTVLAADQGASVSKVSERDEKKEYFA